jgi:hypothetical protein
MSNLKSVKTNFTSGLISKDLYGRGDLSVYLNGARKLQNIINESTGGVSRRKGLKFIDDIGTKAKIISFEFNTEQKYLLCFLDKKMRVYMDDKCTYEMETPWSIDNLDRINWTQSADTLLVVHPDIEPMKITRSGHDLWSIEKWEYYSEEGNIFQPYFKFASSNKKITISGNGAEVTLISEEDYFIEAHKDIYFSINEGLVQIKSVISPRQVVATVKKSLSSYGDTVDWKEQVFSPIRGWPKSVTFHQDRLVIGGSRELPNRLWMSKSSDLFNFDLGEGLDDEAIEFAILSDQVNAIMDVISNRHLLVFTTGAEWMVTGKPLTPSGIELNRQSRNGFISSNYVPPQYVDGATLFVSKNGKQLREFLYTDVEQAYQSKDLTLLSGDILNNPVDSEYDISNNIIYFPLENGEMSCLTSYRREEVNAWSVNKTQGKFISIAVVGEETYFVIQRKDKFYLEKFSDDFYTDSSVEFISDEPKKTWCGLNHLEGDEVKILADGYIVGNQVVKDGEITLFENAINVKVGLAYEHIVEPLPFMLFDGAQTIPPKAFRIINSCFRIINSKSMVINIGRGYQDIPLSRIGLKKKFDQEETEFSGDIYLRSIGWITDVEKPMWSIKSDVPYGFTLLSTVIETKIKQ